MAYRYMLLLQDVVNDIHGAQVLGMKGMLVKTGQHNARVAHTNSPAIAPQASTEKEMNTPSTLHHTPSARILLRLSSLYYRNEFEMMRKLCTKKLKTCYVRTTRQRAVSPNAVADLTGDLTGSWGEAAV